MKQHKESTEKTAIEQHICGKCKQTFGQEAEYLNHKCPKSGFKPTEAGHLGKGFQAVSAAALKRGQARKK